MEKSPPSKSPTARRAASLLVVLLLVGIAPTLHAQAVPTASRTADVQVGIGFSIGKPGYVQDTVRGIAAYADVDLTNHLGLEAEFHQVDTSATPQIHQRTFALGARYLRTYGPLAPYVKGMAGVGIFGYPYGLTSLGYTMFAAGAGADLKLGEHLRVRGDYEYQKWISFPNGGLMPHLVSIGVAYHFAGKPRYR